MSLVQLKAYGTGDRWLHLNDEPIVNASPYNTSSYNYSWWVGYQDGIMPPLVVEKVIPTEHFVHDR